MSNRPVDETFGPLGVEWGGPSFEKDQKKRVWLHFLAPQELDLNEQKVPMAVLTAHEARKLGERLVRCAELIERDFLDNEEGERIKKAWSAGLQPIRLFPVLLTEKERRTLDAPRFVPWDWIAPHEEQAQRNHSQTLARLAERGGLGLSELRAAVEGTKLRFGGGETPEDAAWLREQLAAWEKREP